MTLLLASVRDAAEAAIAVSNGADIVDLKEPSRGALGAVSQEIARGIMTEVRRRVPVSVTIGDIPLLPDAQAAAIEAAAGLAPGSFTAGHALAPEFIKIGMFDGDLMACESVFGAHAADGRNLVAVIFADRDRPSPGAGARISVVLKTVAGFGFAGVMADTARKDGGTLRNQWTDLDCARFIDEARGFNLFVGLAGSLKAADISVLVRLSPDILGFRGALCSGGREGNLDLAKLADVRAAIPRNGAAGLCISDRRHGNERVLDRGLGT